MFSLKMPFEELFCISHLSVAIVHCFNDPFLQVAHPLKAFVLEREPFLNPSGINDIGLFRGKCWIGLLDLRRQFAGYVISLAIFVLWIRDEIEYIGSYCFKAGLPMFAHGPCGHLGEVKFTSRYSARLTRMDYHLFIRLKTTP